jgi:hypothetical protein
MYRSSLGSNPKSRTLILSFAFALVGVVGVIGEEVVVGGGCGATGDLVLCGCEDEKAGEGEELECI